jgi:hypothetical protein
MIVSAASKNSMERPYMPLPYAFCPKSNICFAVSLLSACSLATCNPDPTQEMTSPITIPWRGQTKVRVCRETDDLLELASYALALLLLGLLFGGLALQLLGRALQLLHLLGLLQPPRQLRLPLPLRLVLRQIPTSIAASRSGGRRPGHVAATGALSGEAGGGRAERWPQQGPGSPVAEEEARLAGYGEVGPQGCGVAEEEAGGHRRGRRGRVEEE